MSAGNRKSPLPRRTRPIGRSAPVRKRNSARADANWTRAYHSVERVEFVASQPCANCGVSGEGWVEDDYRHIANAHTENGGGSRKGPYTSVIALCESMAGGGCHDAQHQHGWSILPALDTKAKRQQAAAALERAWREFSGDTK